jgi:hypothetical protein
VDDQVERRMGANEAMCREVNEAIERGQWPGEENAPVAFRCECARLGCDQMIELTVREYERIRSDPRHFAVARGHEVGEVETVVEETTDYVVVEKRDVAGAVAEQTDPRD